MLNKIQKKDKRTIRHLRIRAKVYGTSERPRMSVFRSNKHIYAQIIDDETGNTLCSSSTIGINLRNDLTSLDKVEKSREIGKSIAESAREKGIRRVVFDRGGYKFHGRVKALAESARDGGLLF